MAAAWTAVEALRRAGKDLTRESLVKALDTLHRDREPVPAARASRSRRRAGPLPDRADAAAALAERRRGSRSAASGATGPTSGRSRRLRRGRTPAPTARLCFTLRREETARRQQVTDGTPRLRDPQRVPGRPHGRGARRCARGRLVTYSPKVFIPLTTLCRDVCGYCTFARPPRRGERAFLTVDEVLEIARPGAAAGCTEALFTLGDKPELRYRVARDELAELGFATTIEYLAHCAGARARRDRAAAAPEPRRDEPATSSSCSAPCRPRWGSCSRRSPTGCR